MAGVRAGIIVLLMAVGACAAPGSQTGPEASLRAGVLPRAVPPVPADGVLGVAQHHFRAGNFGYAARYFAQATALGHGAEAWLGLAASYDWLRRFDLSARAYSQAEPHAAHTAAYHNNLGFSRLLQGDLSGAAVSFERARSLAPDDPVIRNNLVLLAEARGA